MIAALPEEVVVTYLTVLLNAQGRSWKRDKVADSAGWIQNSDFDHSEHFECGLPALFADKGLCGIGTSPVIWKSTTLYTQSICHQDTYITRTTLPSPPPYTFGTTHAVMASFRTSAPSISTMFRFTAQPAANRRCAYCLRARRCPFSSFQSRATSSKRPLMTESAHRPQTLGPEMPPPKNSGSPETSISGHSQQTWPPTAPWQRTDSPPSIALGELEAQKSKATVGMTPTTPSQTATSASTGPATVAKPKKSKLRPRKAPIKLSAKAVEQLKELFEQPESKLIRIGVKNRGCSGLAYHLEYVDKPGAFDETVEQDGVKVLIDSKALFSIIGSEMDWLEDKLSARFIFKNPNISEYNHA